MGKTTGSSSSQDSLLHNRENPSRCSLTRDGKERQAAREPLPGTSGPAGHRIGEGSFNADWQPVPSHPDLLRTEERLEPTALELNAFDLERMGVDTATLLVPGLRAEVDDWALQGVDMALFDNLVRGAAEAAADPA